MARRPGCWFRNSLRSSPTSPSRRSRITFLRARNSSPGLLEFQRKLLLGDASARGQVRYEELLGPLIDENFRKQPSAAVAFAHMTGQLKDEIAANTGRILALRRSEIPVHLIWGRNDPYLHLSTAAFLQSQLRNASLHALDAGHWPQIDAAKDVARIMLDA